MANKYITRKSLFEITESRKDANHQLGFDYREEVMNKSVSNYMFGDPKRDGVIKEINKLIVYLIDNVKNIKKTFMYVVPRNSRNIN